MSLKTEQVKIIYNLQMRSPYTEHAANGLPNPTHMEWGIRFVQARDQQVLTHVVR